MGERLAVARRRAGLHQAELGAAMGGYSQSMMSHIEAGRTPLRLERAARAARELKVSLDYLAGLTDDPTPAADLAGRARRGTQLAQLYLTRCHPRTFGKPGLADDPRQMRELERKTEEVASELVTISLRRDAPVGFRRPAGTSE